MKSGYHIVCILSLFTQQLETELAPWFELPPGNHYCNGKTLASTTLEEAKRQCIDNKKYKGCSMIRRYSPTGPWAMCSKGDKVEKLGGHNRGITMYFKGNPQLFLLFPAFRQTLSYYNAKVKASNNCEIHPQGGVYPHVVLPNSHKIIIYCGI